MNLQSLIIYEKKLIQQAILAKYGLNSDDVSQIPSNDLIEKINAELLHTDCGITSRIHFKLILDLIYTYLYSKALPDTEKILAKNIEHADFNTFSIIENIEPQYIPLFCEELHIAFLNSKFQYKKGKVIKSKSKNNLLEKGAVYTEPRVVKEIVETTIQNYVSNHPDIHNFSILDFACGTGRFYECIANTLILRYGISANDCILKHIYAIDIDPIAINITRLKAISFLNNPSEENISTVSKKIICGNALIHNDIFMNNDLMIQTKDFNELLNGKFDAVTSNPPYLVLKINKNKGNAELVSKIQEQVSYFRKSGIYHYSIEGMLNYYQLSIEAILSMVKPGGEIGIICPSSLFADISTTKLRKHLLQKHNLRKVKYFGEKEQLFKNITQATNIFYLQKTGLTKNIEIEEGNFIFNINFKLIEQLFPEKMEIPFISKIEWTILKKMSAMKKLKQIPYIRNRRGELDLTLFKNHITTQKTPFRLVRGNMINEGGIKDINKEFVSELFPLAKPEDYLKHDFKHKRLVCQQISNASIKKRLKFVFCNESDILGNSCNYLSADETTLYKLSLILNSNLLNWRFKITSTNNHINNYELGELPIADLNLINKEYKYLSQNQLDEYIGNIYGLNKKEIQFINQRYK